MLDPGMGQLHGEEAFRLPIPMTCEMKSIIGIGGTLKKRLNNNRVCYVESSGMVDVTNRKQGSSYVRHGGRFFAAAIQAEAANRPRLLGLRDSVVGELEKVERRLCQG